MVRDVYRVDAFIAAPDIRERFKDGRVIETDDSQTPSKFVAGGPRQQFEDAYLSWLQWLVLVMLFSDMAIESG